MISGSIYLGKKAQKAYRRRQARRAAQQLTSPIDIVDPSEEILPTPPPSPTGHSVRYLVPINSAGGRGSPLTRPNHNAQFPAKWSEWENFTQRVPIMALEDGFEQPPAYEMLMSADFEGSLWTSGVERLVHPLARGYGLPRGHQSFGPTPQINCPTCPSLQRHRHAQNSETRYDASSVGEEGFNAAVEMDASQPLIAELPVAVQGRVELPADDSVVPDLEENIAQSQAAGCMPLVKGFVELPA